jgi:hypothetical protein
MNWNDFADKHQFLFVLVLIGIIFSIRQPFFTIRTIVRAKTDSLIILLRRKHDYCINSGRYR